MSLSWRSTPILGAHGLDRAETSIVDKGVIFRTGAGVNYRLDSLEHESLTVELITHVPPTGDALYMPHILLKAGGGTSTYRRFRGLSTAVQLLLWTQLFFNVGFYLVVPFLATFMTESLGASGAMIGLVLGLRTFSQQGLFFLGGGLTDRFGVRPILLTGISIRVLGFLIAATASSTVHLMIGVILIGFAAALFSPAAEAALATAGRDSERSGGTTRAEIFSFDTFFSRTGALIGPVLGALLIGIGFAITCWVAAGIFAVLFFAHLFLIPAVRTDNTTPLLRGWATVLRNKVFLIFALAYSTYLVSYNQQYLALPVELTRARGNQEDLGWMFVYSSVLILLLQLPLAQKAQLAPRQRSLGAGFSLVASGFLLLAIASMFPPLPGVWALAPAVAMLTLMHVGQMLSVPIARDFVGVLAGEKNLGAYFGFLNTFGGLAVLVSSLILGYLLDAAATPQPQAALPWLLMSLISAASAVAMVVLCRRVSGREFGACPAETTGRS